MLPCTRGSYRVLGWSLDLGPVHRRSLRLKEIVKELLEALKVLPGDLKEPQLTWISILEFVMCHVFSLEIYSYLTALCTFIVLYFELNI